MSTPSEPDDTSGPADPQPDEVPFDPYRFGRPDHPIAAEYAPPGYTGPTIPAAPPYAAPPNPYGDQPATPYGAQPPSPYGGPAQPPYGVPPGYPPGGPAPYAGGPDRSYQYPPLPPGPGAPPPPAYHAYVQPRTGNGKAIAALVLGILAIVLCFLSVFDLVPIILATVFGFLALGDARRNNVGGRGLALTGLICAAVGTILAVLVTILYAHISNECSGTTGSEQNHCIREHL